MKLLIPVAVHLGAPRCMYLYAKTFIIEPDSIIYIMRNLFFAPAAYFAWRKIKRQAADVQLQKWKIDWPSY